MQITVDGVRGGIARLLAQPRDVARWDRHIGDPGRERASAAHRALFEQYAAEVRPAAQMAEEVWDREVERLFEQCGDKRQAVQEQWIRRPSGPGGRASFVALLRRFWLACDDLNRKVPADQAVAPESFLLGWLANNVPQDTAVRVLAALPHWPMGLDLEGHWI